MKKIIIEIPDGLKLADISYSCGIITCLYEEEKTGYMASRGEIVKVLRGEKQIGVAIMDNPKENTFFVLATKKKTYVFGKLESGISLYKANIGDISKIITEMNRAGYEWNPVLLTITKK